MQSYKDNNLNLSMADKEVIRLVKKNDYSSLKFLLNNITPKPDINKKNLKNDTLLMFAAVCKSSDVVKLLIEEKANVNELNNDKNSALHIAAYTNNVSSIDELLNAGAFINKKNKVGMTPLQCALNEKCSDKVVDKLLEHKADVNCKNINGSTAIFFSALDNRASIMNKLIKSKANIDMKNNSGDTPLIIAARKGSSDCVKILINSSVNIFQKNNKGETALSVKSNNKIKKLLRKKTKKLPNKFFNLKKVLIKTSKNASGNYQLLN